METLSDHNSVAAENNPFRDAKKKGGEFSIESILLAKGQFFLRFGVKIQIDFQLQAILMFTP